jgi:hypothetical protein
MTDETKNTGAGGAAWSNTYRAGLRLENDYWAHIKKKNNSQHAPLFILFSQILILFYLAIQMRIASLILKSNIGNE